MRLRLKWKFTWFLAGLLLFTVAVLSSLVLQGVRSYQREQMENTMDGLARTAQVRITQQYVTGTPIPSQTFMKIEGQKLAIELSATSHHRVILYDMGGTAVGDSLPMAARPDVQSPLTYALQNKIAYVIVGDTLQYLSPLSGPDGQIGVIHFESSLKDQHSFDRELVLLFLYVGLAVLGFGLLFGLLYMNRHASAISQLKRAAEHIQMGRYLEAPPLTRLDELGDLSHGIYDMSKAIQANIHTQKQFFDNVSHEFKTPLTAIKANADLLQMYGDDPAMTHQAGTAIAGEASRLHALVEKALQLSAMGTYAFEHRPEQVPLHEMLEELCLRLLGKAEKSGITIHRELAPATIWADPNSLRHIFLNLIDNAIKYNTQGGSVTVCTHAMHQQVDVLIQDTGVGISEEERKRIFDPFYTIHPDRARQTGGTGLGLSLVKQFVEREHGKIRVENGPNGQGTTFIVTFEALRLQV
ncbi:sensor histidine kinase [Brevibacillus brevis]|uniref:histidine kinase n=1 Tax=Brevibacillus brevis TaxID=1393 RepID=A0A2Z4MBT7_BREBE|nr:HAMP domain-containing sensor histidine kinase [Brevibacillus brevis]AWX53919.1 sensor histidine kinase [Brevibacillus brevis]